MPINRKRSIIDAWCSIHDLKNIALRKIKQAHMTVCCIIAFYKVQEQAKLIYGNRVQNWLLMGAEDGLEVTQETFWHDRHV